MTAKERDAILRAGHMMSNICFNLKQRDNLPAADRASMEISQRAWDDAVTAWRTRSRATSRTRRGRDGAA